MEKDKACLLDMLRFTQTILQLTMGMDEEMFKQDLRTQLAVLYELTVLGEAVKRLSLTFRDAHPQLPWRSMAGLRDKLIHDYDGVAVERVWEVVRYHLPDLLDKLQFILTKDEKI